MRIYYLRFTCNISALEISIFRILFSIIGEKKQNN